MRTVIAAFLFLFVSVSYGQSLQNSMQSKSYVDSLLQKVKNTFEANKYNYKKRN